MSVTHRERLRTALLALLPKGGAHVSTRELASATCLPKAVVDDLLSDAYMLGHVGYRANAAGELGYFDIPQGNALPGTCIEIIN